MTDTDRITALESEVAQLKEHIRPMAELEQTFTLTRDSVDERLQHLADRSITGDNAEPEDLRMITEMISWLINRHRETRGDIEWIMKRLEKLMENFTVALSAKVLP